MPPCLPALLLALLLLGTASTAWAQSSPCQTGIRRIELEGGSAPPPEICISPGLTTALLFDRELAAPPELEGRSRFERVEALGRSMLLLPSARLSPGERLRLTVRFTAAEAPASAAFVLVVHRNEAERQVEISRAPPRPELCQAELQRKEAELQRCAAAAALQGKQDSLARLLAMRALESNGALARPIAFQPPSLAAGTALRVVELNLHPFRLRTVVEVKLANLDPVKPWRAGRALVTPLAGKTLEPFAVAQAAPLELGKVESVWVELEIAPEKLRESYTLQLWDEDKVRTLTLSGLKLR